LEGYAVQRWSDVLEEKITFIFRVEEKAKGGGDIKCRLVSCFAYSSTLKMEATYSSETSGFL
jgi:hypothetical protein